jgi:hypothetical protein
MSDNKSPQKIKKKKQIFHHGKDRQMIWGDIKHLELEDDDVIHSCWVDDDNFEYHGYWHGEIIRMVEETDEQFTKRIAGNELNAKWAKERRYESYLKLKKEFGDNK